MSASARLFSEAESKNARSAYAIMEEVAVKPGLFSRLFGPRHQDHYDEEYMDEGTPIRTANGLTIQAVHRYQVTVRRQVMSFQDAVACADGLKRGEQQVINLTVCHPELREKIKDFLYGVSYNAEGQMEELGDHIFMIAPASAFVEIANPTARTRGDRN